MQNSNDERQNRSGNELVFYLMEQLYDMKPKIETMKTKIKDMEAHIAAQKKQIETLQNRKSTYLFKVKSDMSVLIFL